MLANEHQTEREARNRSFAGNNQLTFTTGDRIECHDAAIVSTSKECVVVGEDKRLHPSKKIDAL